MQKIRWSCLLVRLSELEAATFSQSENGRIIREGVVVVKAEPVQRNIRIISGDGEEFFFPNEDTFAFQVFNGNVLFKRNGRSEWSAFRKMWFHHIATFRFQLTAPFVLPERTDEERYALQQFVLKRL